MAKSKRVKSVNNTIPIEDWEHADRLLREIGNIQVEVARHEADAKTKIDDAKSQMQAAVNPLQGVIKDLVYAIELFATANKKDFVGNRKSKDLSHGQIGWRVSHSIRIAKDTLERIKLIFPKPVAATCITVKESVNKNGLAVLLPDDLEDVGAKRVKKTVFYAEPDTVRAVEHDNGRDKRDN